jgi:hypothetical protein
VAAALIKGREATEAPQTEKAARGAVDNTMYPWGDELVPGGRRGGEGGAAPEATKRRIMDFQMVLRR